MREIPEGVDAAESPRGAPPATSRRRLLAALGVAGGAGVAATAYGVFGPSTSDTALTAQTSITEPEAMSPAPSGRDDTAALQHWLDHGGRRLAFTAGTYRITAGLTIPAGVTVTGYGACLRAVGGAFFMVTFGGDDVALAGLEVDGAASHLPGGPVDPGAAAILLTQCVRGAVRDCSIHDMPAIGISVNGASTAYLISENSIVSCGKQAISLDHSDDGRVLGNHIDTALHGVQWWGGDSAKSSDIGIRGLVVANNRIANVTGGIWGSLGQHITVTGNRIEDCSDVGVDFEGCQDCVAVGNSVHNAAHACYSVFYSAQRIVFDGNVGVNDASGNSGHGFKAYRQPANQRIEVSNNQLLTIGAAAFDTDAGSLAWSTVRGNSLQSGPSFTGVHLVECDEIRVTDNEVVVEAPTGIAVEGGSACQVDGNHVLTTADASAVGASSGGVHLLWRSADKPGQRNRVRGNVIRGFVQSVFDDCGGDAASFNLVEGNVAATVVRRNMPGWTGVIENNRSDVTHALVAATIV